MISPFLAIQDQDTILLEFGVFVAEQARTYRVSQSAIIAAINQQPAAPSRPTAAASTTPPVDATAEGAPPSSADLSQAKAADDATIGSAMSEPLAPVSGPLEAEAASRGDGARSPSATSEVMDATAGETAPIPEPDKSVGASAPAAPVKRVTNRQRVIDCHNEHPDWNGAQIADALGMQKSNVWSVASQVGIKFSGKKKATTEALRKAVAAKPAPRRAAPPAPPPFVPEVIPPANPQKPVGSPPKALMTLSEKVRALHQQHPNWTAVIIAKEIGANSTSVGAILAQVRGDVAPPTPKPEFSGRREMVEHYGEIAKRLGKRS